MEKKGMKKEVKLYFVLPTGNTPEDVNDCMKMAFQESKEASLSPKWLEESECLNIPTAKNMVFVLQEFVSDSKVFTKLRSTKSLRVCGPMCLRSCLAEDKPIPDNKSPVFTTAMRDIVVTASQVSVQVKADIKQKVSFMGGIYMSNLSDPVTHLVTNAVRSAKYEVAAEKGLPIMTVEWVEAVWRESQARNIRASDPQMMAKYKCPVFYNMFIACSNLSKKEKDEIKTLVTDNGGTFTPQMRQAETTLLVVQEPQGLKYQHARNWGLPCVKPSYIHESVAKGYAVPSKGHLVEPTVRCSTPTKDEDLANFTYNSDPSLSVINFDTNKTHIDDTQMSTLSVGSQQRQQKHPAGSPYLHILKTLSISDAKKAGSFSDGCKVYLSGFSGADREKLTRILSLGGATVFTELSDSVSHILLGEFVVDDMRALSGLAQKPHVVTLEWLAASVSQRAPAAEEPYYCLETRTVGPEPPSPLSQKGMQLLKPQVEASESSMMPPPPEPAVNRKLFSEFVKENTKSPAKPQRVSPVKQMNQSLSSTATSQDSIVPDLFLDKKFQIIGYDSESTENMEESIVASGGSVVAANFKGVADYAIVPLDTSVPNVTALEVVTYLWLEDCMADKAVIDIQYYHQPLSVDIDKRPLGDCCLSFSSYCGREKTFLIHLAESLGALYQDILVKVYKKKDDIELMPTTHLVCPKPEGKKYTAAIKWGLTIVTKDWLLACARINSRVAETSYIVTEDHSEGSNSAGTDSSGYKTTTPVTKPGPKTPDSSLETPKPSTSAKQESFKTPNTPAAPSGRPSLSTPSIPHPVVSSLKRKSCAMTPNDQSPFHVSTPDTPYGQAITTPTAEGKKRWKRFIDDFPSSPTPPASSPRRNTRRQSTPLSELKRRAYTKALETSEENISPNYSIEEMEEQPESAANHSNVKQSSLRENADTSKTSPKNSSKNTDGNKSQLRSEWSSPEVGDFKSVRGTSSSKKVSDSTPSSTKQSVEKESDVCKMLDTLHQIQLRQRLSNTPTSSGEDKRPHVDYKHLANQPTTPAATSTKPETNPILDPESQPIVIGWEEPVETAEKLRMLNMSSPSTNRPRKFVLSNVNDKDTLMDTLSSLGEVVSSKAEFEQDTTHLIVDAPVRSEKLLCCLAGGRWVLHTSYIERMALCGKYVPEEEKFEWGNPSSSSRVPALPSGDIKQELAQAAYRWRKKVNGSSDGAFKGMKAMLFTTQMKRGSYERLITAGGGVVLEPILSSVSSATHCFVEKMPNLTVPLKQFASHDVPCLPPLFLGEMLTNPNPNVENSLIPEYKQLLASRK